jgi:hypothetical protein
MADRNGKEVDGYKAEDFGADRIVAHDNWRDSGYTHYTAFSDDDPGSKVSWSEAETSDGNREVADVHVPEK